MDRLCSHGNSGRDVPILGLSNLRVLGEYVVVMRLSKENLSGKQKLALGLLFAFPLIVDRRVL